MEAENGKGTAGINFLMLLPVILAAAAYIFTTTDRGVIDYDEAYYAEAAKNMAVDGDWITPYVNGVRFLEKPPLLYWITALSFKVFGVNEFALRFPTALAVIVLVWFIMRTAERFADKKAALIAGLSTAFGAGTYIFTRETLHDVWLVLFMSVAVYAFSVWYTDSRRPLGHALLFYAATAGAAMCKSLIGVVFPAAIVFVFFLIRREVPQWRSLHMLPGSALFLGLTVPWHWLASIRNQGFLEFFFLGEQFLRFFGRRDPPVLWSVPLPLFWLLLVAWFFPWIAFLPASCAVAHKSGDEKGRQLTTLALVWAGVVMVFFSLSDRLEHYAFPALPALSLLIAATLSKENRSRWIIWGFRGLAFFGILALTATIVAGIWLTAGHPFPSDAMGPMERLSETDFSIMKKMPPAIVRQLSKPALLTAIAMAAGFLIALWFESRRLRMHAVMSLVSVMIVVCGMVHWSLVICEDLISSKKFGLAIANQIRPGDRLVVVGDYESANSLRFYQPLMVEVVEGTAYALLAGMKYAESPKLILTREEFQGLWRSSVRVFALVPKMLVGDLKIEGTEVTSALHRVLMRNH